MVSQPMLIITRVNITLHQNRYIIQQNFHQILSTLDVGSLLTRFGIKQY